MLKNLLKAGRKVVAYGRNRKKKVSSPTIQKLIFEVCPLIRVAGTSPAISQEYDAGNSVIIDTGCKARMKLRSCTIWVLGLLLAIASVDTVPDPPAVNPRAVGVAYILGDVCGDVHERWLNSDSSVSLLLQVRWTAFTSAYEPNLPTDRIVLTGFATDPSPPSV